MLLYKYLLSKQPSLINGKSRFCTCSCNHKTYGSAVFADKYNRFQHDLWVVILLRSCSSLHQQIPYIEPVYIKWIVWPQYGSSQLWVPIHICCLRHLLKAITDSFPLKPCYHIHVRSMIQFWFLNNTMILSFIELHLVYETQVLADPILSRFTLHILNKDLCWLTAVSSTVQSKQ